MSNITNIELTNLIRNLRTALADESGTTTFTEGHKQTLDHISYNPVTNKIEADRAVETTLNSFYLGEQHKLSSGSENIYFTNLSSNVNFYPMWGGIKDQSLAENQTDAGVYVPTARVFGSYGVAKLGGDPVLNTAIPYDGDNFFPFNISGVGITTTVAEAVPAHIRLKYELSVNGTPVYDQILEHNGLAVNQQLSWFFDHPLDIVGTPTTFNHASIRKIDVQEQDLGLLLVCQGSDEVTWGGVRYQTEVQNRLFEDKVIAYSTDLEALDVVGYYDLYVDPSYVGTGSDGTNIKPYTSLATAIAASASGNKIFIKGDNVISSEIVLPHSLKFFGIEGTKIRYSSYDATNGNLLKFTGVDNTQEFSFHNIEFNNAGEYALKLTGGAASVDVIDCKFKNNGWNGGGLSTVLPEAGGVLGYNSSQADLQAFYAGTNASNGGAMRIETVTNLQIVGNKVMNNLRGIRVADCGINGNGFITRNVSAQNIESGIYLSVGAGGGCQNITVTMNFSAYNANNGLLVIGGINNKFSQNEVNGNWNAGFCAWGAGNTSLRDSGLYDNNRSTYNGIGNTGDAKASIQINEAYNLLGTQISLNPAARFIAEILDTQVHYTGLGSNTEKIGFLITSAVGALADNDKNIIKIDDVGFIGQDYAIDLSEVDVTNLRLSLGDNSYQTIGLNAVKPPIAGKYSELPFSNHVMKVPKVDVVVDTLKQTVTLHEDVGGNVINSYAVNQLQSVIEGSKCHIILKNSDKIQLRDVQLSTTYVNGVLAGNSLSSMNDTLNAAFNMNLVQYKEFFTSEVGLNDDASSGGSLPVIANNWYISYGAQSGTQMTTATIGNTYRAYNPFYNGEALEKGHEFVWTHNNTVSYMIGLWGAAQNPQAGSDAVLPSNWLPAFGYYSNELSFNLATSSGVSIEQKGNTVGKYEMSSGQLALRFGLDSYLYLFEIVSGGYSLIGRSNSTVSGASIMVQWGSYNQGSFPVMQERTDTWELVHDFDSSQNSEWAGGMEEHSIIKSRMSFSPGEKITMNFNYFGRTEHIGIGYSGASSGVNNAETTIASRLFYNTSELLKDAGDWTWNQSSNHYYNPVGDHSNVGYWNNGGVGNLGLISLRYKSDNTLELWHETNNELIATLTSPLDGLPKNIFWGSGDVGALHPVDRIPTLNKYNLDAVDTASNVTEWWYIESPDGNFEYPLFKSAAEANYVDTVEGGGGTSATITFVDDLSNTTWYKPTTNYVNNGVVAPQHGVWGGSTNIIWNEQETGADANYAPTFTDLVFTVQEQSAVNAVYKPAGDTATYNITNIPSGYADTGNAIVGSAETITDGNDVQYVINVTKVNEFGSDTGTITLNITDDPTNNVSSNSTPWTKALDFSGSNEHLSKVYSYFSTSPIRMADTSSTVAPHTTDTSLTSNDANSRPWATTIVFKSDGNSSNQHIWNQGEGTTSGSDNIYLRVTATGQLYFGWGREGSGYNEKQLATVLAGNWFGVYIGFKGVRWSASNATATNLDSIFDIRVAQPNQLYSDLDADQYLVTPSGYWMSTGARMDRTVGGNWTIAGRGTNRNFHGQIASCVVTTLKRSQSMPDDTEIKKMITDPLGWVTDYRIGKIYRPSFASYNNSNFQRNDYTTSRATQVWLMGDGSSDSFSNGIRNDIYKLDQNETKLRLVNMQSNDFVNVNITGLS